MPRDSNGNYSLPPGYIAVTGQTVQASQHNPPLEDLASSMTGSLPRNGSAPMTGALSMGGFRATNLAAGVNSTDAATKAQAEAAGVPIGGIVDYAGSTAPVGWLLCYGQEVARVGNYALLFAAIGTTYGVGDGATTFNVPDLRGRVAAGKDNMGGSAASRMTAATVNGATLGAAGGGETHTLTAGQAPVLAGTTNSTGAHVHADGKAVNTNAKADGGSDAQTFGYWVGATGNTASAGDHSHTVSVNSGGGAAHPNVQPTIIMNKIIRTG